jgi:hypothetical protein
MALRQDWDQTAIWQGNAGPARVSEMTLEQITEAMSEIALMPRLSAIAPTVLFQALKARGQELQAARG